jgi:hypothetical protein
MMSWLKQKKDSSDAYNAMLQSVEKVTDKMADVKSRMAKLKDSIQAVEKRLATAKKNITDTVNKIRKAISTATNPEALYTAMEKSGISKDQLTRAQRFLLSVRQVGIGRSWIDYSELTVKNISIAGFNIEMNPSRYYLAFAAGKVNYRFRDFIYNNNKNNLPNQSVALMRAGIGRKEKNNVIVTFYDGKKSVLNSTNTAAFNAVQHILGVSVEARYALDANNYLTAEIAKSSYYSNAAQQPRSSDLTAKLFNLKESSNQAYSVKLNSYYPQSNTRFTGFYKKLGENFQSFTLYPAGTNQEAWMARFNQLFWKKRLTLDAAIRKNDFVSPVAAPSFNSKNIFKSLQATLRVPKYPFVSVGYFPSSQLSLSNNNILTESQYNTLNAVVSHSYLFKQRLSMNTNLLYTKFFNSGTDTGFIYFNAASWSVNHSIFISQLQFQSGLTVTDQQQLHLVTLEQQLSWQARKTISFSAGLKWTRENHDKNLFGGTAAMSIYLKRLGNLLFHYDKTYLPGYNRTLVPVDIGQFSFYREF